MLFFSYGAPGVEEVIQVDSTGVIDFLSFVPGLVRHTPLDNPHPDLCFILIVPVLVFVVWIDWCYCCCCCWVGCCRGQSMFVFVMNADTVGLYDFESMALVTKASVSHKCVNHTFISHFIVSVHVCLWVCTFLLRVCVWACNWVCVHIHVSGVPWTDRCPKPIVCSLSLSCLEYSRILCADMSLGGDVVFLGCEDGTILVFDIKRRCLSTLKLNVCSIL